MAGGGSSDDEENFWPEFVDALTVMTMVLTFIMMVLGLVVFSLSQNTSRAQLAEMAAAAKVEMEASSPLDQVQKKIIEVLKSKAAPNKPKEDVKDSTLPEPPAKAAESRVASLEKTPDAAKGTARIIATDAAFTIAFEDRGFQLDAAVTEEFDEFVRAGIKTGTPIFEIKSFAKVGGGAVTEARRLAYYRGMVVRQQLVKSGIPGDRVRMKVDDAATPEAENAVKIFLN